MPKQQILIKTHVCNSDYMVAVYLGTRCNIGSKSACQNWCRLWNMLKGCGVFRLPLPEKNTYVWWNPWGDFANFFGVILHCRSSLIFLVLSKAVQVWEVIINIAFAMSRKQCSGCNCPLTHAVDGRNLRCGTIGSCQSTTAFEIVKWCWSRWFTV